MKIKIFFESLSLLLVWIVTLATIVLPLLPLLVFIVGARLFEEYLYETLFNAKRFNSEEIVWLHDDSKNLTIINSMVMLGGRVNVHTLRKRIIETLTTSLNDKKERQYPRTTKYVHHGYLNNYWIEETNFRIEDHVYEWSSNEVVGKTNLQQVLSSLAIRSLVDERKISPWEYIVIHYRENKQSKSVIFMRSAHSLADGTSYVYFLVNRLNEANITETHLPKLSRSERIFLKLKGFYYIPFILLKVLFLRTPQKSALHTTYVTGKKHLTWSKPIKLQYVKSIKDKLNVTVNDVLTGCMSTHIHKYFKAKNEVPPNSYRVCLPADTRLSLNEAQGFSNKFAVLLFDIPTSSEDPLKNTLDMHVKMNSVKQSGEAFSIRFGLTLFGYLLPECVAKRLNNTALKKTSMVLSNVPGPIDPVVIANQKVEFFTFWPPQKDTIGCCVSFMSYNGYVIIGAGFDEALMKNPDKFIENFEDTMIELGKSSGLNFSEIH